MLRLKPFLKSAKIQIRSIKLSENAFTLLSDRKKFDDCRSKEYLPLRKRVENSFTKEAIEDCQIVMNYGISSFDDKFRFCFKHYGDEMKFEINLLAHGNSAMYNKLSDCFFNDKHLKAKLTKNYLKSI